MRGLLCLLVVLFAGCGSTETAIGTHRETLELADLRIATGDGGARLGAGVAIGINPSDWYATAPGLPALYDSSPSIYATQTPLGDDVACVSQGGSLPLTIVRGSPRLSTGFIIVDDAGVALDVAARGSAFAVLGPTTVDVYNVPSSGAHSVIPLSQPARQLALSADASVAVVGVSGVEVFRGPGYGQHFFLGTPGIEVAFGDVLVAPGEELIVSDVGDAVRFFSSEDGAVRGLVKGGLTFGTSLATSPSPDGGLARLYVGEPAKNRVWRVAGVGRVGQLEYGLETQQALFGSAMVGGVNTLYVTDPAFAAGRGAVYRFVGEPVMTVTTDIGCSENSECPNCAPRCVANQCVATQFLCAFDAVCRPGGCESEDAGQRDAGSPDAGSPDAGRIDAGAAEDAGIIDGGMSDAGIEDRPNTFVSCGCSGSPLVLFASLAVFLLRRARNERY